MTTVEYELNTYTIEYDGDGPSVSVLYPSYTGGGGGSFDGVHNDLDGRSTSGAKSSPNTKEASSTNREWTGSTRTHISFPFQPYFQLSAAARILR